MTFDPRNYINIPNGPRTVTSPDYTIGHDFNWGVLVGFPFFIQPTTGIFPLISDHWLILDKPVISWNIDVGAGKGTLLIEVAHSYAVPLIWVPWAAFVCVSSPYPNTMEGLYVSGVWMRLTMIAHNNLTLAYTVKAQAG